MRSSTAIRPEDLVLRCYAQPDPEKPGSWRAHCIDFDLWGSGEDLEHAEASLDDAIAGYIETVLATSDRASIAQLIRRRAPLKYRLLWRWLVIRDAIGRGKSDPPDAAVRFEAAIPFALGRSAV